MATERKIRITAGKITAEAVLNDSPTARKVWDALPIEGCGNTWGDEIYFAIPVDAKQEKEAREIGMHPKGCDEELASQRTAPRCSRPPHSPRHTFGRTARGSGLTLRLLAGRRRFVGWPSTLPTPRWP